jgi:hypothetical protein
VAIVNEAFAQKYLGGNAVGKRIQLGNAKGKWLEVVGMTVTGKHVAITEPPLEFIYLPLSQNPLPGMTMIVETNGDPAELIGPLRDMIRSIDPNLPIFRVRTLDDLFEQRTVKSLRVANGVFASAGFVWAGAGSGWPLRCRLISGSAQNPGNRRSNGAGRPAKSGHEDDFATRWNDGRDWRCHRLVLSIVISRGIAQSLGISPFNPVVFGLLAAGLVVTTLLAATVPARRASQIDPQQALRQD